MRERLTSATGDSIMYLDASRIPDGAMTLMTRLETTAVLARARPGIALGTLGQRMREALKATDPFLVARIRTLEQAQQDSTPDQRFHLAMFGAFALMAGLLAAIGIYGVTAYGVEQRKRKIGVRVAIGCTRPGVICWILREVLATASVGDSVRLVDGSRICQAAQFSAVRRSSDRPGFFFGLAVLFTSGVALAAGLLPALRAGRTDPLASLRN